MPTSKELWFKAFQCRRLAERSLDVLTIERLRAYVLELTAAATEAEDFEARAQIKARYTEVTATPEPKASA